MRASSLFAATPSEMEENVETILRMPVFQNVVPLPPPAAPSGSMERGLKRTSKGSKFNPLHMATLAEQEATGAAAIVTDVAKVISDVATKPGDVPTLVQDAVTLADDVITEWRMCGCVCCSVRRKALPAAPPAPASAAQK